MTIQKNEQKLITVSICGSPNVGKSTIVNLLCGVSLSIVTDKPQTTRFSVKGIINSDEVQIIFIDTPGVFKPKTSSGLDAKVAKNAWIGLRSGEIKMVVIDPRSKINENFKMIAKEIESSKSRAICVINKMDILTKEEMDEIEEEVNGFGVFDKVFRTSAKLNYGFVPIIEYVKEHSIQSPWIYKDGVVTDISDSERLAEITRKHLYNLLSQEVPYQTNVVTEILEKDEQKNEWNIGQVITVNKESQKKIAIGAKGSVLKKLLKNSSSEMQKVFKVSVKLKLFIRVRELWWDKYNRI